MKRILQNIWGFVSHYRMFSVALVATLVGLILDITQYDRAAHVVLGGTAVVFAVPMFVDMVRNLRMGTYGVDILAITAIVTAVVMKEYYAAMVIVLMLSGGEALEDYAENRAKREMTALLNNAPRIAHVLKGQKESDVSVKRVQKGNKIIIRMGEVVPVDAVIVSGSASFDEASITGESVPEHKNPGDELLSGAVNVDGTIIAKALRPAEESQYEQIVKLVRTAAASRAPFVRMADRFAVPFTAIAFAMAIGAWLLSGDSMRFLQVMVVATPCPLILAAPIAIISGISRASKAGIIVKNGTALERLSKARSFAFDKTGTLTHGQLAVSQVITYGRTTKQQLLEAVSVVSQQSNHITSRAIVAYAKKQNMSVGEVKHIKELAGKGISATVKGKQVLIGRPSFLAERGVEIPSEIKQDAESRTSSTVAIDGKLAGLFYFEDQLRAESKSTISYLRKNGVEQIYLITGDNEQTALKIAKAVGIAKQDVVAKALPVDKLRTVEKVANHPVAYVGDGVNDAPVLVAADVGIALGAKGSSAASESADIVIMKDSLAKVSDVHAISRRTFTIARQSILVGIGLSVILMAVFATGRFSPVIGAAVQEVVDVVVIFNALRAHVAGRRQ